VKTTETSQSRSLVVYSNDEPKGQDSKPGANSRYRFPRIEIESRPLQPLLPGSIRVRINCVGICGTDLHLLEKDEDGYTRCSSPSHIPPTGLILGHEGVGVVSALGQNVTNIERGDIVCFESIVACNSCVKCRQGSFNQCEHSSLLGMQQDGIFTEYADVPASVAHRVNDIAQSGRDLEALACVEPAAVAYLACVNARIIPGETVAVFGAGPIGFFAALMAKTLFGASQVCVSEPVNFRREFAKKASDRVLLPKEFSDDNQTLDVLIDAAGNLSDTSAAISKMNGNGRIVLLARTGQSLHIELVDQIISKNLHITGSRGHLGGPMNAVLSLVRAGRLDLHAPVTTVIEGFDQLAGRLTHPAALVAGDCKVVARLG
jgi:threonine dehydrogenase-like Zn-dependent dehydrogenase